MPGTISLQIMSEGGGGDRYLKPSGSQGDPRPNDFLSKMRNQLGERLLLRQRRNSAPASPLDQPSRQLVPPQQPQPHVIPPPLQPHRSLLKKAGTAAGKKITALSKSVE